MLSVAAEAAAAGEAALGAASAVAAVPRAVAGGAADFLTSSLPTPALAFVLSAMAAISANSIGVGTGEFKRCGDVGTRDLLTLDLRPSERPQDPFAS